MEIVTAIAASKSLLELGQDIGKVLQKAQDSPDVIQRILLYLEAIQAAVNALGLERQRILSDVRRCDVGDRDQIDALWTRLDRYLYEDNIRFHLNRSIVGLGACRETIEKEAKAAWWRKRDKKAAVEAFLNTLNELESTLRSLTSNFYPGGSGMGIQTLMPIYELISINRHERKPRRFKNSEIQATNEQLGELVHLALRDSSHEDWWRLTGRVEALVVEMQLAFSVKVTKKAASNS